MHFLTKSDLLYDHLVYIRSMDAQTRRLLRHTSLVSEIVIAFYHLLSTAQNLLDYKIMDNDDQVQSYNLHYGSGILALYLDM